MSDLKWNEKYQIYEPPLCINCKYYGIQHPDIHEGMPKEEYYEIVKQYNTSHGICMRNIKVNPVNGDKYYWKALYERQKGPCGDKGKFFQPREILNPESNIKSNPESNPESNIIPLNEMKKKEP